MAYPEEGRWALIVHGGAKEMEPGEEDDNLNGVLEAARAGIAVLEQGGNAVDAVEASIKVREDLPVFNAGHGSALNEAGEIEMGSGLMDGKDLSFDKGGNLAAGTSTSGLTGQKVGRVGDSPLPGHGLYADIISVPCPSRATARASPEWPSPLRSWRARAKTDPKRRFARRWSSYPEWAARGRRRRDRHRQGRTDGRIGWAHNSPAFAIACASAVSPEPRAFLSKEEEKSA